jgi:Transposase DDE domain
MDAYFLSRLKPKALLYVLKNGKKEKLCMEAIYKKLQDNRLGYMEIDVFLDKEATNPVRLVVELIPDDEFARRMRKAAQEATKKKRVLSKKYKSYARLGLYVTNIPRAWVPIAHIRSLYRLRWQIELRFKAFKSHCKLAKIKKIKKHRMECYLFANLLHIMLNWQIAINFFGIIWQNLGKTMSILKFFKTIEAHKKLQDNALKNTAKMRDYLLDLYKTAAEKLLAEKKKNKLSMAEIFNINIS